LRGRRPGAWPVCWGLLVEGEEGEGSRGWKGEAGFGCEADQRKRGSCGWVCADLGGHDFVSV